MLYNEKFGCKLPFLSIQPADLIVIDTLNYTVCYELVVQGNQVGYPELELAIDSTSLWNAERVKRISSGVMLSGGGIH